MGNEHGEWILHGLAADDPRRIRTPEELVERVEAVGFLPLFQNEAPGFSVEEWTLAEDWWSGDPARDPWLWRALLAAGGRVPYGKFFARKAGFVSLRWLPRLANWRRDGYDFDARWEDGRARHREKKLMDLFADGQTLPSFEARQQGGFGKGGERNFEGTVTDLQMQTYLVIRDFRRRRNKAGAPYGWPVALYTAPESLWGAELLSSAYGEEPEQSRLAILRHLVGQFPEAGEAALRRALGK